MTRKKAHPRLRQVLEISEHLQGQVQQKEIEKVLKEQDGDPISTLAILSTLISSQNNSENTMDSCIEEIFQRLGNLVIDRDVCKDILRNNEFDVEKSLSDLKFVHNISTNDNDSSTIRKLYLQIFDDLTEEEFEINMNQNDFNTQFECLKNNIFVDFDFLNDEFGSIEKNTENNIENNYEETYCDVKDNRSTQEVLFRYVRDLFDEKDVSDLVIQSALLQCNFDVELTVECIFQQSDPSSTTITSTSSAVKLKQNKKMTIQQFSKEKKKTVNAGQSFAQVVKFHTNLSENNSMFPSIDGDESKASKSIKSIPSSTSNNDLQQLVPSSATISSKTNNSGNSKLTSSKSSDNLYQSVSSKSSSSPTIIVSNEKAMKNSWDQKNSLDENKWKEVALKEARNMVSAFERASVAAKSNLRCGKASVSLALAGVIANEGYNAKCRFVHAEVMAGVSTFKNNNRGVRIHVGNGENNCDEIVFDGPNNLNKFDFHGLNTRQAAKILDSLLDYFTAESQSQRNRRNISFTIVVGIGMHSEGGKSKLRPFLSSFLKKNSVHHICDGGEILITI